MIKRQHVYDQLQCMSQNDQISTHLQLIPIHVKFTSQNDQQSTFTSQLHFTSQNDQQSTFTSQFHFTSQNDQTVTWFQINPQTNSH